MNKEVTAFAECIKYFCRDLMDVKYDDAIQRRLLYALKQYFGFSKTAFFAIYREKTGDYSMATADSAYLGATTITSLSELLISERNNPFLQTISKIESESDSSFMFEEETCADAGIFFNRLRALCTDCAYVTFLLLRQKESVATYVLMIYKSGSEGDFTEDERWLINYLGQLLPMTFRNQQVKIDHATLVGFLRDHLPEGSDGFCVLNGKLHTIEQNSMFQTYYKDIFGRISIKDAIIQLSPYSSLTQLWSQRTYSQTVEGKKGEYIITMQMAILGRNDNNRYYMLIKIRSSCCKSDHQLGNSQKQALEETMNTTSGYAAQYYKLWNEFNLSKREIEVFQRMEEGLKYADIARELCLSSATVKTHIRNILGKLGVNSRSAAVAMVKEKEAS